MAEYLTGSKSTAALNAIINGDLDNAARLKASINRTIAGCGDAISATLSRFNALVDSGLTADEALRELNKQS